MFTNLRVFLTTTIVDIPKEEVPGVYGIWGQTVLQNNPPQNVAVLLHVSTGTDQARIQAMMESYAPGSRKGVLGELMFQRRTIINGGVDKGGNPIMRQDKPNDPTSPIYVAHDVIPHEVREIGVRGSDEWDMFKVFGIARLYQTTKTEAVEFRYSQAGNAMLILHAVADRWTSNPDRVPNDQGQVEDLLQNAMWLRLTCFKQGAEDLRKKYPDMGAGWVVSFTGTPKPTKANDGMIETWIPKDPTGNDMPPRVTYDLWFDAYSLQASKTEKVATGPKDEQAAEIPF